MNKIVTVQIHDFVRFKSAMVPAQIKLSPYHLSADLDEQSVEYHNFNPRPYLLLPLCRVMLYVCQQNLLSRGHL
jgi:hypothetical protein